MQVKRHRLFDAQGAGVPFEATANQGGRLVGGKPRFIIIHYTANGSARGTVEFFKNPVNKVSAHLVVGHDGDVTQMVAFNERAWHAGRSSWMGRDGLNACSVGIEIVNWGKLQGATGRWKTWTGTPIADDRVVEAAHRHHPGQVTGWEIFDTAQLQTVAAIVRALGETYGIAPDAVLGHDDISPQRKSDPGPAWDMQRFRAMLGGRAEEEAATALFEVTARRGLNMRSGPGIAHERIKLLTHGTLVSGIETDGLWWLVAEISDGAEDDTGWVHSHWLAPR